MNDEIVVYYAYDNSVSGAFSNLAKAMKFIYNEAYTKNYGIFRQWTLDDYTYFDCGDRVYKIKAAK